MNPERIPRWPSPLVLAVALSLTLTLTLTLASCAGSTLPPAMNNDHHVINYLEFTVPDLADAKRFYGEAFGWTFQDYGPEYAGIQRSGGVEFGGLAVGRAAESPTGAAGAGVLAVVHSTDLDASFAAVKAAGGRIVKEPFDFPGGRRFQFLDPAGNELAVWTQVQAPQE